MKKTIILTAIMLFISILFCTSCALLPIPKQITKEYTIPETFWVTFESVDENGKATGKVVRSEGLDAQGNIYADLGDGKKYVFIKEGEKTYWQYTNENGAWIKNDRNLLSQYTVDTILMTYIDIFFADSTRVFNKIKEIGTETVASRECTVYEAQTIKEEKGANYKVRTTYQVTVDNETKCCLGEIVKEIEKVNVADGTTNPNTGYICTKLETENLDFAKMVGHAATK